MQAVFKRDSENNVSTTVTSDYSGILPSPCGQLKLFKVVPDNFVPGQYFDKETNLYYNYFRDYDPSTGRYIQSDPLGLYDGPNTYSYVGGNPVNFIDFYGLSKCSCAQQQKNNSPDGDKFNERRTGPNGQDQVYRFGRWNPTYDSSRQSGVIADYTTNYAQDFLVGWGAGGAATGKWKVSGVGAAASYVWGVQRELLGDHASFMNQNYSPKELSVLDKLNSAFAACARSAAGGIDE